MRSAIIATLSLMLASHGLAGTTDDFSTAISKWKAAGVSNYSFHYKWNGAVVIAPPCADALIRVRVRDGKSDEPVVVKGTRRCPTGTKGERSIGFAVPRSVDAAFDEMRRYISAPPVKVAVRATYDPTYGVPIDYYVEKLEFADNDEGFVISNFKVSK